MNVTMMPTLRRLNRKECERSLFRIAPLDGCSWSSVPAARSSGRLVIPWTCAQQNFSRSPISKIGRMQISSFHIHPSTSSPAYNHPSITMECNLCLMQFVAIHPPNAVEKKHPASGKGNKLLAAAKPDFWSIPTISILAIRLWICYTSPVQTQAKLVTCSQQYV